MNEIIKKPLFSIIAIILLILGLITAIALTKQSHDIREKAESTSSIYITPATQSANPGSDFSFVINLNTGDNLITGIDVLLLFEKNVFEITSMEKGSGITSFDQILLDEIQNNKGELSFAAFTLDKTKAASGTSVEVLRINGKIINNAADGEYLFSFDPSTAASAVSEGVNVLSEKRSSSINVTSVIEPTLTPTPEATPTQPPDIGGEGDPNSCNGTCGSNNNCQSNLFCYNGFCKNPQCPNDSDCACNTATPTNTPTATATAKSTSKPIASSKPTNTNDPTPQPTTTSLPGYLTFIEDVESYPTLAPVELPTENVNSKNNLYRILAYIAGSLFLLILGIFGYTNIKNRKNNPSVFHPDNL